MFNIDAYSGEYDDLEFDVEAFEKRDVEYKGYGRVDYTFIDTVTKNKHSTLNEFNLQTDIDKSIFDIHFDLSAYYKTDSVSEISSSNIILNSLTQSFGNESQSFEIGKKVQRWGKGYSYSSVAFFERQKDPIFPELAREGFWMLEGQLTRSLEKSAIKNYTLTLLGTPDIDENRYLFTSPASSEYGGKLYLLIWDIDLDIILANNSYGVDFSFNLLEELEFHAEYGKFKNSDSYLIGFRYQSITDTTIIGEFVNTHEDGRFYYTKAIQKEPLGVVYSNAYLLYTNNIDSKFYRTFLGVNYDFKNGLVLDGSVIKNTQGNGVKLLIQYFF
jgi:hypothetical protein